MNLRQLGFVIETKWLWIRRAIALAALAAVILPTQILAQSAVQREYEIKAAYLYNFINYIEWPADSLPPVGGTITIGIVGDDPNLSAFETLNGKQTKGRSLSVKAVNSAKDLEGCQIVFVFASARSRIGDILDQSKTAGVLTVGEVEGFAARGGVINFISEHNKVRFEINPDVAKRLGLNISSELLKLARLVKS